MIRIQGTGPEVIVQTVADLHEQAEAAQRLVAARLDAEYYGEDGHNPYAKLAAILPKTARFFVMVPEADLRAVHAARRIMAGLKTRRFGVRESRHAKRDLPYNQFAPPGEIILLYT